MLFQVLNGALSSMQAGPRPLSRALKGVANLNFELDDFDIALLRAHLSTASVGDDIVNVFRRALAEWDNAVEAPWTGGTKRNTGERRAVIYRALDLDDDLIRISEARFPPHTFDVPVLIADEHEQWYTDEVRNARNFYWAAYVAQLRKHGWLEESIAQLDQSTNAVVERLSNPASPKAYQSKGLVMGYVQSGKTSNFTGVIAKAADAGYKLIIVLAGTLDVLRSQTQRRVDKDMIGQELLGNDYISAVDWDQFLKHGARPSELGSFDWYRLTGPESDYRELSRGVEALKFEGPQPTKPLWDRDNLFQAATRIAIVKKNSKVLKRLLSDLQLLKQNRIGAPLDQVPVLIIDDESDQASINVSKATANGEVQNRTATNNVIVDLLKILPRAQYVGYTATPFANVFVDPNNEEDIFPKDFLVSLPRPADYMGVSDFYDLEGSPDDPNSRPNERDYVRSVKGDDLHPGNLQKAIDAFVLSGALKLYREDLATDLHFRHHTMLVHSSARVIEHKNLADKVRDVFARAGYEGGAGVDRLEHLLETDFRRVSESRKYDLPFPSSFGQLVRFVGLCLSKIGDPDQAVRILNNENPSETPDFDKQEIWGIVVGGTKLSRGYTVEGLTISYYRRGTKTADTLMQMGRWFGFRRGYRDLVRLFIGTHEPLDKTGKKTINLYDAFGAVCRDEEMFRAELRRYASMEHPRILPRHIPPLVPSHMLKPTAANKMYNARISHRNFGGRLSESTFAPAEIELVRENNLAFTALLGASQVKLVDLFARLGVKEYSLSANIAELQPEDVLRFVKRYQWFDKQDPASRTNPMLEQIDFLQGTGSKNPEIDSWLLFAPQIPSADTEALIGENKFSVVYRSHSGGRFTTYNDPKHRRLAEYIAMIDQPRDGKQLEDLQSPSETLKNLRQPKRAVMMFYLVSPEAGPKKKPPFTPAFALVFPNNHISAPITFGVIREDRPKAVVVPGDDG